MDTRKELRLQLRHRRRALTLLQQKNASNRLLRQIIKIPGIQRVQHIAIYLASDGEINTQAIISWCRMHKKQLYLPVLHPLSHNRLWFARYTAQTPMKRNKYGIWEPRKPYRFMLSAKQLDLVLLPLVGFDEEGGRLGMGGGYYDRTFNYLGHAGINKPRLVGLAHELQKVETLPVESWDVPLSGVATDQTLYLSK